MSRRCLIATALMGLAAAVPGQQVYKWVDEKGVTQYTATPPPSGKAQAIKTQPANSSTGPRAKSWQEQEIEFKARQVERAEAQHKQELAERQAAQRRLACASAQRNLQILEEQRPVYTVNEKGGRQFLDDVQRAEAMRKAREFVEQQCSQ